MAWVDVPDKHQQILDAAEQVFGQHGFAKATVEAIADQAGVGKGTVYLYFQSKQDVFLSVIEDRLAKHLAALDSELESVTTSKELLSTVILRSIEFFLQHQGIMNALWEASPVSDGDWRSRLVKCGQTIGGVLLRHMTKVKLSDGIISPQTLLDAVMGAVHGVVSGRMRRGEKIEPGSTAKEIEGLFLYGVLGARVDQHA